MSKQLLKFQSLTWTLARLAKSGAAAVLGTLVTDCVVAQTSTPKYFLLFS